LAKRDTYQKGAEEAPERKQVTIKIRPEDIQARASVCYGGGNPFQSVVAIVSPGNGRFAVGWLSEKGDEVQLLSSFSLGDTEEGTAQAYREALEAMVDIAMKY
jgi:hypothetical protein